jgi:hypothetical protein
MSSVTNSESQIFEILPGLPGHGPAPEQFSATGHGKHSEGLVVRFHPRDSISWVANFVGGFTGFSRVLLHPDGHTVVAVHSGQAYHVDPRTRKLLSHFGGGITDAITDAGHGILIYSDGIRLWAFDSQGSRWTTARLSWDGIRDLKITQENAVGEAYDPMQDKWLPFSVSLATGAVTGGSYGLRLS